MTASTLAPVLPGETLAQKYRVERILGRGGMGVVVAARHLELDERVAIKFLLEEQSAASGERFLREARAAAKVKSEHVCRVFDFGRLQSGEPYFVMEYLEGMDLGAKLAEQGVQSVPDVAGWMIEVCAALAEAHALGIVHRDLKPANVFLARRSDESTCAKVLDFGISKVPTSASWVTQATSLLGSPQYMSPEQIESARDVDLRTDVWGLGVMLYELLSGKVPFDGESLMQLAYQVREREPQPIEELRPEIPVGLARVITKCLAKSRDDRYASVAEVAAALAPFAHEDARALVARIKRRGPGGSDPALPVLAPQSRDEPGFEPTEPARPAAESSPEVVVITRDSTAKTRAVEVAGGTTLHASEPIVERDATPPASTRSESIPPRPRRARLVAAALASIVLIGGIVAIGAAFKSKGAPANAATTLASVPLPLVQPTPTAQDSAAHQPTAPQDPPTSPNDASNAVPHTAPPKAKPAVHRSAGARASAMGPASTPPPTPSTLVTASATTVPEVSRARTRDLDRSDPFAN